MKMTLECPACYRKSSGILPSDPLLSFGVCCGFCGLVLMFKSPEVSWSIEEGRKDGEEIQSISRSRMIDFKEAIEEMYQSDHKITGDDLARVAREHGILVRSHLGPAPERTKLSDQEWEESDRILKMALG